MTPAKIVRSLLVAAASLLCRTDTFAQARPLFTQHERQLHAGARANPLCRPEPYETPIVYSELTVFESREVVYRISALAPCLGEVGDPPFALRWEAPGGKTTVFRSRLSATCGISNRS